MVKFSSPTLHRFGRHATYFISEHVAIEFGIIRLLLNIIRTRHEQNALQVSYQSHLQYSSSTV